MRSSRTPFRDRIERIGWTGADILAIQGVEAYSGGPDHLLIRCPSHDDHHPSCSINIRTGWAKCFTCGFTAGDVVALHKALGGFASMGAALSDLENRGGAPIPELQLRYAPARGRGDKASVSGTPECVANWFYTDAKGAPVFEVRRIQVRLPDGSWFRHPGAEKPHKIYKPWAPGADRPGMPEPFASGTPRPLYRLPEVLAADPATAIYVVEGEPAADALRSIGWTATTSSGGASAAAKTDWSPLAGRHVVVWPDHDDAGAAYADQVTELVLPFAARIERVRVAELGLAKGGDAVDWVAARRAAR